MCIENKGKSEISVKSEFDFAPLPFLPPTFPS